MTALFKRGFSWKTAIAMQPDLIGWMFLGAFIDIIYGIRKFIYITKNKVLMN